MHSLAVAISTVIAATAGLGCNDAMASTPGNIIVYKNPCSASTPPSGCTSTDPTTNTGSMQVDTLLTDPIQLSDVVSGINSKNDVGSYVAVPHLSSSLKTTLVLVIPGSDGDSTDYEMLANRAAFNGFPTISLEYDDKFLVGNVCGTYNFPAFYQLDQCYTNLRGAQSFGVDYPYDGLGGSVPSYCPFPVGSSPKNKTVNNPPHCPDTSNNFENNYVGNDTYNFPTDDSIVGRLVTVLDQLSTMSTYSVGPMSQSQWSAFLVDNSTTTNSPYKRKSNGHGAYPNWKQIIIVGHSQGGGAAGFIAFHLPAQRLIELSSIEDLINLSSGLCSSTGKAPDPTTGNCPVSWESKTTGYNVPNVGNVVVNPAWPASYTGVSAPQIWGLRHGQSATTSDEGNYAYEVSFNWNAIPGFFPSSDVLLDDGACLLSTCATAASGKHRFVISQPANAVDPLFNHITTGAGTGPAVAYVWDLMLTN
jgi:hypothetical protein